MERDNILSVCTYEGGLLGLSIGGSKEKKDLKDVQTEYSMTVTEGSIQSADGSHNLMALGGFSEVIRLFDIEKKKDLGDLMGDHNGTITALQFYKNKFLISGSEDSQIIIWRCKDWQALHKLVIKNTSKVVSMSLHPSGKILFALYANGVLRLWNMMEARCKSKRKMGVIVDNAEHTDNEDADLEITVTKKKDLSEHDRQPIQVLWEASKGTVYAVLYNKMVEVFSVHSEKEDEPITQTIFDSQVNSMAFISATSLVVSDTVGNLHLLKNIGDDEKFVLQQMKTKFERIKEVKASYTQERGYDYLAAISNDSRIGIYDCAKVMEFDEDLEEVKASKVIKYNGRLTCIAINNLVPPKKKKLLGKRAHGGDE